VYLGLRFYPLHEKCIVERTNEYLKDRTEEFDDYYVFRKAGL
jgi:hypothetical protein